MSLGIEERYGQIYQPQSESLWEQMIKAPNGEGILLARDEILKKAAQAGVDFGEALNQLNNTDVRKTDTQELAKLFNAFEG